MFRRPSWSSDGSLLIGAAASVSGSHAPLLIEREKWTFSHFPVGHKAWITVTASNPSIFVGENGVPFLCYALADVTQVLTVWATKQESALLAVSHCMDSPVTDLRWSPDGCLLLLTSLDGTVLMLKFAEGEIGRRLTEKEKESRLRETYGATSGALFEDPHLLEIYQQRQRKLQEEAIAAAQAKRAAPVNANPGVQTEMMVKGRRKIVPVLVAGNEISTTRTSEASDAFKNVFAVGNITPMKSANGTPVATETAPASSSSSAPSAAAPTTNSSNTPSTQPSTHIAPTSAISAATVSSSNQMATDPSPLRTAAHNGSYSLESDGLTITSPSNSDKRRARTAITPPAEQNINTETESAKKRSGPYTAGGAPSGHNQQSWTFNQFPAQKYTSTPPPPSTSATTRFPPSPPLNGGAGPSVTSPAGLISQLQTHENQKRTQRGRGKKPKQTAASSTMDVDDDGIDDLGQGGLGGGSGIGGGGGGGGGGGTSLLLPLPNHARRFIKKVTRTAGPSLASSGTDGSGIFGSAMAEITGAQQAAAVSSAEENVLEVTVVIDEDGVRPPKSIIKYFEGGTTVSWQDHIEDKVTVLTGNTSHLIAAGCDSGDVYIYSPSGRRLFPAINISSSAICALECHGPTLLAVATEGMVKMWDVALGIAKADTTLDALMLKHFSVQSERMPIAPSPGGGSEANGNTPTWYTETEDGSVILNDFVSKFAVSESGQALCVLQSGQIYGYSTMMASWTCLYSPNWQKDVDKTGLALGQLSALQRASLRLPATNTASMHSYSAYHGLAVEEKRQRTVAHLETQLASTAMFGTSQEYRHFAKLYVRELAELIHEKKLTEYTTMLLGPVNHSLQPNASWDPYILGVPKREILEDVLPEMLRPELQRLVSTLKEALQSANKIAAANRLLRSPPVSRTKEAPSTMLRDAESTPTHSRVHSTSQSSSIRHGLSSSSIPVAHDDENTSDSLATTSRGARRAKSTSKTVHTIADEEEELSLPGIGSRSNSSKPAKRGGSVSSK